MGRDCRGQPYHHVPESERTVLSLQGLPTDNRRRLLVKQVITPMNRRRHAVEINGVKYKFRTSLKHLVAEFNNLLYFEHHKWEMIKQLGLGTVHLTFLQPAAIRAVRVSVPLGNAFFVGP
jgi:hypothetical protein